MYNTEVNRGSRWLKWDCHVHTPISYENNFPNFDEYIHALKAKSIEHKTDVIIINDYFTLDGYKKIISYCSRSNDNDAYKLYVNDERSVAVLPGLELRIDNFTQKEKSINVHIFFNQRLSAENIENGFLNQLKISYGGYDNLKADRQTLIKIGYSIINGQPYDDNLDTLSLKDDSKYINKAISIVTVTKDSLIETIDTFKARYKDSEYLKENCMLTVVAFNGYGALSELAWNEARAGNVKRQLLYLADICFSSREKDINFLLGKDTSTTVDEIRKLFGRLKPCVWGSDSHEIATLLHPSRGNTNRYTWIKGMNNFEGLKQIIFEPENRVAIQEDTPNTKADYQVIDKVKFIDSSNIFMNDDIVFNEDLNTIIGGKSSGKSLLLSHIARTINGIDENFGNYQTLQSKYSYDFEVYWKDGQVSKLSNINKSPNRKVKYISQMFVNKLAENKDNSLNNIVTEILMENTEVKQAYDQLNSNLNKINLEINNKVYKMEKIIEDYKSKNTEKINIGDDEGIKKEILKLEGVIEVLVNESKMSAEEINEYNRITNKISNNFSRINMINNIIIPEVGKYKNYFKNIERTIKKEFEYSLTNSKNILGADFQDIFTDAFCDIKTLEMFIYEKISMLNIKEAELSNELAILVQDNNKLKNDISNYEIKLKNKSEIDRLSKNLEEERMKKEKIEEIERVLNSKLQNLKSTIKEVENLVSDRNNEYKKLIDILKKDKFKCISEETNLILKFELQLKEEVLKEDIGNILNKTAVEVKGLLDTKIDVEGYNSFVVGTMINAITGKGNYKYKNGKIYLDLIKVLVKDYLELNIDILENDDEFYVMSPGKQGLIVLKLLIHLSSEKYPILIDQPEDNLDNRTISHELKNFILNKKRDRQIIMVTHNPNLTVLADSDEIIVANQSGKDGKGNRKYRFEYVSGPLELSFRKEGEEAILYNRGIKEHVCEILEGGKEAFKQRENKYGF